MVFHAINAHFGALGNNYFHDVVWAMIDNVHFRYLIAILLDRITELDSQRNKS